MYRNFCQLEYHLWNGCDVCTCVDVKHCGALSIYLNCYCSRVSNVLLMYCDCSGMLHSCTCRSTLAVLHLMDHLSDWFTDGVMVSLLQQLWQRTLLAGHCECRCEGLFPQCKHAAWLPLCRVQRLFFLYFCAILWKICVTASTLPCVVGSLKLFPIMTCCFFSFTLPCLCDHFFQC